MNFKKNIILSSVKNIDKNVRGVFTIEKQNNVCTGILRIYNYTEVNGNFCLGIMVNGVPLQKIALNSEVVFCKVDLPLSIEFNSKISVIVVKTDGVKSNPIVFGSTQNLGYSDMYNIFSVVDINSKIESEVKNQISSFPDEVIETNYIDLNKTENNFKTQNCYNCVYKQSFYTESEEIKEDINKENSNKNFFEIISPKIEELFEQNEPCEQLNSLIASSKWVTINVDENESYYIGVIYENTIPKYIGYAVKGIYSLTPPKELEPTSQWLPIDNSFSTGEGYWVMFQDAVTGE